MKHLHPSHLRLPADRLSRQARYYRQRRERLLAAAAAPDDPANAALLSDHHAEQRRRHARRLVREAQRDGRPVLLPATHRRVLTGPTAVLLVPGRCRQCGADLAKTPGRIDRLYCGAKCGRKAASSREEARRNAGGKGNRG